MVGVLAVVEPVDLGALLVAPAGGAVAWAVRVGVDGAACADRFTVDVGVVRALPVLAAVGEAPTGRAFWVRLGLADLVRAAVDRVDGEAEEECGRVAACVGELAGDAGRSDEGDDRGGWPAPKAHASTLPGLGE